MEFTDAQRELIEKPGSVFVEACPGAGKTQCIVERFIRRPELGDRRGVALLSFTNAAVNEARSRCADRPELIRSPNYVGTIDSFINRYLVTPIYSNRHQRALSFKDSWATVPGSAFRVSGTILLEFHLAWFKFDHEGSAELVSLRAPAEVRKAIWGLSASQRANAESRASALWRRFIRNGVIDCASSRAFMQQYLREADSATLLSYLIESRFAQTIIDEVQDCSDSDIALFNFLLDTGIEVVMVGDLDQAIYGFRDSRPTEIRQLVNRVRPGTRLSGNFRSSAVVCRLVDSLRYGNGKDVPRGKWAAIGTPIHVLPFSAYDNVPAKISAISVSEGLKPQELVVLAHAESIARAGAGDVSSSKTTANRLVRLATAANILHDLNASSRSRTQAIHTFERTIRELGEEQLHVSDKDFFDATGLDARSFREGCMRLALGVSPFEMLPSEFRQIIKGSVVALGWSGWADVSGLRSPNGDTWPEVKKAAEHALTWSTIHSYKGLAAPGVAVVIPKGPANAKETPGVTLWCNDQEGELRRLLYVAVSRAERLAILVVHRSEYQKVLGRLTLDGVSYVTDESYNISL